MPDRAQQRLAVALGISAVLHLGLVHTAPGPQLPRAPRAASVAGVPITVSFTEPPVDLQLRDIEPRVVRLAGHGVIQAAAMQGAVAAPKALAPAAMPAVPDTASGGAALPQPSDPTYYTALSLDVYPEAVTGLELDARLLAGSYVAGQVRATVLIDESGTVNEVRALDAVALDIEQAARDLLSHARFTPARKDGRVVKAQVRVSLNYGTSTAP